MSDALDARVRHAQATLKAVKGELESALERVKQAEETLRTARSGCKGCDEGLIRCACGAGTVGSCPC